MQYIHINISIEIPDKPNQLTAIAEELIETFEEIIIQKNLALCDSTYDITDN